MTTNSIVYYNCSIVFSCRKSSLPNLILPDSLKNQHQFTICYSFDTKANLTHTLCTTVSSSAISVWLPSKHPGYTAQPWQFVTTHFEGFVPKASSDITITLWEIVRVSQTKLHQHTHGRVEIAPQKRITRKCWVPGDVLCTQNITFTLEMWMPNLERVRNPLPSPTPTLMSKPFITRRRKFPSWLAKLFASSVCYKSLKTKHYI